MNETERDSLRLRAFYVFEAVTALVVVVAPLAFLGWGVLTARGYGAPWWAIGVGLAFPGGFVARLVAHKGQISNALWNWHEVLVEKVESS